MLVVFLADVTIFFFIISDVKLDLKSILVVVMLVLVRLLVVISTFILPTFLGVLVSFFSSYSS